ncbi:translation elongation factor-like protein [Thermoproteota archaeon]
MAEQSSEQKKIGEVIHFFTNINVAVIKLSDELKKGDEISIHGTTTDFKQKIDSMQIDRKEIESAGAGQEVGMKVAERVREGDIVYKL